MKLPREEIKELGEGSVAMKEKRRSLKKKRYEGEQSKIHESVLTLYTNLENSWYIFSFDKLRRQGLKIANDCPKTFVLFSPSWLNILTTF